MILRCLVLIVAAMIFPDCKIENSFLYFPNSSVPSEESLQAGNIKAWQSS